MLIGIVGAPNKGKSTLFSALTLKDVEIADYPFTTINPNMGIAYISRQCVEKELNVKCTARNSLCENGIRKIPINIVDVAGLVEGAHEGKGRGNQFLSDLAAADVLILVVDASGKTDPEGNSCSGCDPTKDVEIIRNEIIEWLSSIVKKHLSKISKRTDGVIALQEVLTGLKVNADQIKSAIGRAQLTEVKISWDDAGIKRFATQLLKESKPIIIAANKCDAKGADENIGKLQRGFENVIATSGAIELALNKAKNNKIIDYASGSKTFNIIKEDITPDQRNALKYMLDFLKEKGTNLQHLVNYSVFDIMKDIIVYPVEDENKYTDHFGNVLPDAILIKKGSTAFDLANSIHTDIGKNMLYAIDARTKMRLAKDYVLKDNDVIKIVSAAR
jgi:ribosome-binding ATPase